MNISHHVTGAVSTWTDVIMATSDGNSIKFLDTEIQISIICCYKHKDMTYSKCVKQEFEHTISEPWYAMSIPR